MKFTKEELGLLIDLVSREKYAVSVRRDKQSPEDRENLYFAEKIERLAGIINKLSDPKASE